MLFPKYQELIQPPGWNSIATGAAGAAVAATTVRVPITREKHLESIYLRVFLLSNDATTTFAPLGQGLAGMVKRVTFTANNRQYINNVSGVSLLRLAANIDAVDSDTENTVNQVATTAATAVGSGFQLTYPIFFGHPQITEPVRDALIIPMPLFNEDGVLEITFDSWANFVTIGGATGAAILSAELVINRWHAPTSLPHVVHELNEYDLTLSASGRAAYELPALGSYTGLLVTTLSNATPAAASDLIGSSGYLTLELASTTIRKTRLTNLIRENLMSKVSLRALNSATVRGFSNQSSGYFDCLNDGFGDVPSLNSVVDANPSATGGARFRLNADLTAAGILRIVSHRLYGDLTSLKLTGK